MDVAAKIAPLTFENMVDSLTKLTDKKLIGNRLNSRFVLHLAFLFASSESVI